MNPYRMTSYSTLMCFMLLTAVSTGAQQNSPQSQRSWEGLSSTSRQGQERPFRGTIDSVRQANLVARRQGTGSDITSCACEWKTDAFKRRSRPRQNWSGANLQAGDPIRIQGATSWWEPPGLDGRPSLRGWADDRVARDQARSRNRTQQTLEGRVDGFRRLNLRSQGGQSQQHSLVMLQMQEGRSVVVDLGPNRDLDNLPLQRGDRIQIRGTRGTIDGRSAVMADQIRVDGENHSVKRAHPARRGNPSSSADASTGTKS